MSTLGGSPCRNNQREMTPTPAVRQCHKQQATTLMRNVKSCQELLQKSIDQYNHLRQVRPGIKQVVMKLMLVARLYHNLNHSMLNLRL